MRHNKKINHLGRTSSHRHALLANLATSLILHKRITTTVAKAKALRVYIEPLVTKAKEDTTHSRRVVFSYLKDKHAVSELFREIGTKVADRPGGYTRILKTGNRMGDNADVCIIEFVDYNENMLGEKVEKAKPGRRSRRGTKKVESKVEAAVEQEIVSDTKSEVEDQAEKVSGEESSEKDSTEEKPSEEK